MLQPKVYFSTFVEIVFIIFVTLLFMSEEVIQYSSFVQIIGRSLQMITMSMGKLYILYVLFSWEMFNVDLEEVWVYNV